MHHLTHAATAKWHIYEITIAIAAIWFQAAHANTNKIDRFALPPTKVNIGTCQQEALRLHTGMIDKVRMLPQQARFWVRYEIQMRDGQEWSVLCDLSNSTIIRDQRLDSEVTN